MVKIESYVFFDIETTGLPHQERNKTKITEISFVAATRKCIEDASLGSQPHISKLTSLFNPQKVIDPTVTELTGLSNESLKKAPIFKERIKDILDFLNMLPKPICLVAHNGNRFDFKILLAEFLDANAELPKDLLCVDSLTGFRNIHKQNSGKKLIKTSSSSQRDGKQSSVNDISFNDSVEDWPELNISKEDWDEIDSLCSSFGSIPLNDSGNSSILIETNSPVVKGNNLSFTLTNLYKRLLKKEVMNAHRAEDDCVMLLECVVAEKDFLLWADKNCKSIHVIEPLDRKRYKKY